MGYFDRAWKTRGTRGLKFAFYNMLRRDRASLTSALGDTENSFPVVYLLAPEAEAGGLEKHFCDNAKYALWITSIKENNTARAEWYASMLPPGEENEPEPTYEALRWMLLTGCDWDGPSAGRDSFDAAIDLAAAYFTSGSDDGEVLRKIAMLMFRRNRQGLFVHDLVWAFFRTANAETLSEIAGYIKSQNAADRRFACTLLGIGEPQTRAERERAFLRYSEWLSENRPYIHVTDESFNAESMPAHLSIDREAKHVHREIDPRTGAPLTPFGNDELRAIEVFRAQNGGGAAQ